MCVKNSSAVQTIRYANTSQGKARRTKPSQTNTKDKCFEKSKAYDNIECVAKVLRWTMGSVWLLHTIYGRKHFYAYGTMWNVYTNYNKRMSSNGAPSEAAVCVAMKHTRNYDFKQINSWVRVRAAATAAAAVVVKPRAIITIIFVIIM